MSTTHKRKPCMKKKREAKRKVQKNGKWAPNHAVLVEWEISSVNGFDKRKSREEKEKVAGRERPQEARKNMPEDQDHRAGGNSNPILLPYEKKSGRGAEL